MAGFNHLSRPFSVVNYDQQEQNCYKNLELVTTDHELDYLFIADDSEWDTSHYRDQDTVYRQQDDIISHQYVLKYASYPAVGIVIYRRPTDSAFSFWDMLSVVRYYLYLVGYQADYTNVDYLRLSRQLGIDRDKIEKLLGDSPRIPPVQWVGFFSGVDLTAYGDWKTYLDVQSKKTPGFVALNKQEFFSTPFSMMIKNKKSRRKKYPITIKFSDAMALGPQGGLAALGNIVGQKKLNTKLWDLEDDLITYRQYKNSHDGGYYKQHMRYLLDQRPDDYQRYALGDSEVTLKYLDFILGNVIKVANEGLIEKVHVPATLTSLADEISATFSQQPYSNDSVSQIFHSIFEGIDVNQYLRPEFYNQQPSRDSAAWNRVLTDIVTGKSDCKGNRFGLQRCFVKTLKAYLAKGSVTYAVSKHGHVYQKVIGSAPATVTDDYSIEPLANKIDYQRLYADNPSFDISDLENQRVKPSKLTFSISTTLRNQYADHAHQFIYTRRNVPPTIDDLIQAMNAESIYSRIPWFNKEGTVEWTPERFLVSRLDFDKMRKGYDFIEPKATDSKHKKGTHDQFSVRADSVYNDGYQMALHAYVGGMNLSFNSGIIVNAYTNKYDIDLKSSYVNAGHLIPDFRLDTKPLLDTRDLNTQDFIDYVNSHLDRFPNGPFTVGVCNVSYHFADNVKRVPVGYKPPIQGAGPVYVRQANRVDMTLTDVIDLIKHGATVRIHRLIIPQQKTLNGDVENLAPIAKMQHWSLVRRNGAKAERKKYQVGSSDYQKYDSLQLFYKLLGNGGYGKSGQGLGAGGTRDFISDQSMYVPFSRNTNPYTAAQYTSIARYQVNCLMDLMEKLYPDSLIPSVTTDGFIFCTNSQIDEEVMRQACAKTFDLRWIQVNHENFCDQYFELKSHNPGQKVSTKPLYNIRTRFNMTTDSHIKALVGLQSGEWSVARVVNMINNGIVTFKVNDFRMQSLVDMKHSIDHKKYTSMKTWQQPKWLNFNTDDTYQPIGFVPQGKFGYYLTQPFSSVDEEQVYKEELKPYRSLFPFFKTEYGEAFMQLDQSVKTYSYTNREEKHVAWVHEDVPLKARPYPELIDDYRNRYVPLVMIRYIANHQDEYDLKELYQAKFSDRYARFASFKQALSRNKGKFVNPLCTIKEDFDSMLEACRKEEY